MLRRASYLTFIFTLMIIPALLFQNCGEGFEAEGGFALSSESGGPIPLLNNKTNYRVAAEGVYYEDSLVDFVDKDSFKVLGENFAEDKNTYFVGREKYRKQQYNDIKVLNSEYALLDGVPVARFGPLEINEIDSFKVIKGKFGSTSKGVYYLNHFMPGNIKKDNFVYLGGDYSSDGNIIYYRQVISGLKLSETQYIGGNYLLSKGQVYHGLTPINADSIDYKVINNKIIKLGNYYYYESKLIEGGLNNDSQITEIGRNIYKDDLSVYHEDMKIEGIDPSQARIEGNFLVDNDTIYKLNHIPLLKIIDSEPNITMLGEGYYIKNNKIYYGQHRILGADLASFQVIKGAGAKDKNNYYIGGQEQTKSKTANYYSRMVSLLKNKSRFLEYQNSSLASDVEKLIDFDSYQRLGYFYSLDKNNVYAISEYKYLKVLDGVSPETFKTYGIYFAQDGDGSVYYAGKKVDNIGGPTFKKMGYSYAIFGNQIYYSDAEKPFVPLIGSNANDYLFLGSGVLTGTKYFVGGRSYDIDRDSFHYLGNGRYFSGGRLYKRGELLAVGSPSELSLIDDIGVFAMGTNVYCGEKKYQLRLQLSA